MRRNIRNSNAAVLALLVGLASVGLVLFFVRVVLSFLASFFGFEFPIYAIPGFLFLLVLIVRIFPTFTGRTVTFAFARMVGFLSVKVDSLHLWNLKAAGIQIESPSLGIITLGECKIIPDWANQCVYVEIFSMDVEMRDSTHLASKHNSKRKRKRPRPFYSFLYLFLFVRITIDSLVLKRASVRVRIKNANVKFKNSGISFESLMAQGGFDLLAVEVSQFPMLEISQLEFNFHSGRENGMTLPCKGISFDIVKLCVAASSASVMALKESFPQGSDVASTTTSSPPPLSFPSIFEGFFPISLRMQSSGFKWLDSKGVCMEASLSLFSLEVSSPKSVKMRVSTPTLLVLDVVVLKIDSLIVEVWEDRLALVLVCTQCILRPVSFQGFERAHIEALKCIKAVRISPAEQQTPPPPPSPPLKRIFNRIEFAMAESISIKILDERTASFYMEVESFSGDVVLSSATFLLHVSGITASIDGAVLSSLDSFAIKDQFITVRTLHFNLAAAAVLRGFRLYSKLSHALQQWRKSVSSLTPPSADAPPLVVRKKTQKFVSGIILGPVQGSLFLGGDLEVKVSVASIKLNQEESSSVQLSKIAVFVMEDLPLVRVESLAVSHDQLILEKLHVTVSKQSRCGEVLTAYFHQRKALTTSLREGIEDFSTGSIFVEEEEVKRVPVLVMVTDLEIELEDDVLEDDGSGSSQGYFSKKRRRGGEAEDKRNILRFACPQVKLEGSVSTSWKSQTLSTNSDLSLLKREVVLSTRAFLLKNVYLFDCKACPQKRLERAFDHGFGDLMGMEVSLFEFGPGQLFLSDYPLPLLSFEYLSLGPCKLIAADLRPVLRATASKNIVLGEISTGCSLKPSISVLSTFSFAPMKIYFELGQVLGSKFQFCYGECYGPSIVALDRSLLRAMPLSSDTMSPKLGWWDKMRYMVHGSGQFKLVLDSLSVRILTKDPYILDECIMVNATRCMVSGPNEDEVIPPSLELDQRVWDIEFDDWTLRLGKMNPFLKCPRVRALLSLAWRCHSGGDHYVQLHHDDAVIGDQYSFFRTQSLDLGMDVEVRRTWEDDFLSTDKCPSLEICWRQFLPLLFASLRGLNPPVAPPVTGSSISLGKCLTKITFNVRCTRPHVLYWEDESATSALLLRGQRLDSQVILTRANFKSPWIHDSVLAQFYFVEAFILTDTLGKRDFGMGEKDYCYGISFPHEPFYCAPGMRLTLGAWGKLVQLGEGDDISPQNDAAHAYRLKIEDFRLLWTLVVRDELFRFFGTVTYLLRKEAREQAEIALRFGVLPNTRKKESTRKMDLNLLFNRQSEQEGQLQESKLSVLLSQRSPLIIEDRFVASSEETKTSRDRPSACSTETVSADLLKSTWEESSRSYTLELTHAQVCLISDRSLVGLNIAKATIRDFRLALIDWVKTSTVLLRKETDIVVEGVTVFATVLSESSSNHSTKWGKRSHPPEFQSKRTSDGEEGAFDSARGSFKIRNHSSYLDSTMALIGKFPSTLEKKQALRENRRRSGEADITSYEEDACMERIGFADGFQVTDIVYTDTSGGAKVPSSHLGIKMKSSNSMIRSKELFAVLQVLRNLLFTGPPPDVRELAELAQQEALEEMKKLWQSHHLHAIPPVEEDADEMEGFRSEELSLESEAKLKLLVMREVLKRGSTRKRVLSSQRIVYELEEFHLKLLDDSAEERLHVQVFSMRGDHSFALNGSTKVDFEVGNLLAFDMRSQVQIVESQLLDKHVLAGTPFLRADGITSAPLLFPGYRITVYEMLQIHLFPGARYRFKTNVSQSMLKFLRNYFVPDEAHSELDIDVQLPRKSSSGLLMEPPVAEVLEFSPEFNQDHHQQQQLLRKKRMSVISSLFKRNEDSAVPSSTLEDIPQMSEEDQQVIRSGSVTRLAVPKVLQQLSEPVVSCWNLTPKRRTVLLLLIRKQEACLELHRSELNIRLGVSARAIIRLRDIFKIQLHKMNEDDGAPVGTLDIFYHVGGGGRRQGEDGVFTWVSDADYLIWMAAIGPGLCKDVLNPQWEETIHANPVYEAVWRRSSLLISHPRDQVALSTNLSTANGGSDDEEDDAPSLGSQQNPPQQQQQQQQLGKRVEVFYFKYLRVGQIQMEIIKEGTSYLTSLQGNAYCSAQVYHGELWTWYQAFKTVQRFAIRHLFASYLAGGIGANFRDENEKGSSPTGSPRPSAVTGGNVVSPRDTPRSSATLSAPTHSFHLFRRKASSMEESQHPAPLVAADGSVKKGRGRRHSDMLVAGQDSPGGNTVEEEDVKRELLFGNRNWKQ